jgi:alanine-synthesizing transaminase
MEVKLCSMFSRRSQFEQKQNLLSKLLALQQKKGKKVIDLTESNPTRCHFKYPSSWLKSLSNKENLLYEPDPRGNMDARRAIQKYYSQFNVAVDPKEIILTSSTSEAYHFLFSLLLNPGDHLLVPAPGYPLIDSLSRLNDINVDFFFWSMRGRSGRSILTHWKRGFMQKPGRFSLFIRITRQVRMSIKKIRSG